MTKKMFITLRVLIVAFTMFILGWLFFSRPSIVVSLSDVECEPVGWTVLGTPYDIYGFFDLEDSNEMDRVASENGVDGEADRATVRTNVNEGCNLARDNRKLYMILLTVAAATAFITLPKPKQKQTASKAEETTSKEIEPTSKGLADEENKEN